MEIFYNNKKYRYIDNQWEYFYAGSIHSYTHSIWYTVINKDINEELNRYIRIEKLKRILDED
jgi:hypothetical protein